MRLLSVGMRILRKNKEKKKKKKKKGGDSEEDILADGGPDTPSEDPDWRLASVGTEQLDELENELPICMFGPTCYRKNPDHFREFRHPWLNKE